MPEIPGLPADVYFGSPLAKPVDWTKVLPPENQDDDPTTTPEERQRVRRLLGFDPRDIDLPPHR